MLTALVASIAHRTIAWINRRQAAARHRQVQAQAQGLIDTIAAANAALDGDDRGAAINGMGDHARLLDGLATLGKALKRAGITRPAKPKSPQPVPPMIAIWENRGDGGI